MINAQDSFQNLVDIMLELREKCPWDKQQTNETLRYLTLEESYELSDAIIDNNFVGIKEELGDLLLHVIFYAIIAKSCFFNSSFLLIIFKQYIHVSRKLVCFLV